MRHTNIQLQLEAAAILALCVFLYAQNFGDWLRFGLLFFLPDLSILLYFVSARAGAWAYNICHFYGWPLTLFIYGWLGEDVMPIGAALIWTSHIAFDRMLGWGLKFEDSFYHTHLGIKRFPWQK